MDCRHATHAGWYAGFALGYAGSAFFMLRYLGFEDVKVHDESWISWSAGEE